MRRLAFVALVAAAGCSEVSQLDAGPGDRFYFPTGMAVTASGKLLVASSNFDLRYDEETGGSVIAVDPALDPAPLLGTLNVHSLGGQLALAEPAACDALRDPAAGAVALLPVRGSNVLYQLRVAPTGAVSCTDCVTSVGGSTNRVDPFATGVACGAGIARGYVGYLQSSGAAAVTQVDLSLDPAADGAVQHRVLEDYGQVRGFAYDAARERLFITHTVNGAGTSLRWVDLGGKVPCPDDAQQLCPCRFDKAFADGGCATGTSASGAVPSGLELRAIALSTSTAPPRRAYLTARVYDPVLAAAAGYRVGDFDGKLLVADLGETLEGQLDLEIVNEVDLGYGAADVVVLPPRAGKRDVVAALAADSGRVVIYDDETGAVAAIGADLTQPPGDPTSPTGAPLVGRAPFGLAVDPSATTVGRLYVGSFQESFVTPIDVPLDDPTAACLVAPASAGGSCIALGATPRRISSGVTP